MANPDPETDKARLRAQYLDVLRGMGAREAAGASSRIARGIARWLQAEPAIRRLAIFAALPGEPDLALLHGCCPGVELHYPLVLPRRRLSFHLVTDPATLGRGRHGIREPDPRRHPERPVGEIDAFVCPGLAFDASGTRLGRGGGFYDRILAETRPGTPRIGVCFDEQRAGNLPREPHDIVMTHLAGGSGVRSVTPSPAGSS